MSATRWTGAQSRRARKAIRARGRFQRCWRCGREMDLDVDTWHAGHLVDRMDGGTDIDVQAECPRCNLRAGGKRGARIVNNKRRTTRAIDQRLVKW